MDIDESIPDQLEGDAMRLNQVFVNLIGNALKFTPKGSVSVTLVNEGSSNEYLWLGITIADTGIGINEEILTTIFMRFQRGKFCYA